MIASQICQDPAKVYYKLHVEEEFVSDDESRDILEPQNLLTITDDLTLEDELEQ